MKFDSSFTDIQKQVHIILPRYIQIWHFCRTLSRGLLFSWTQCSLHYTVHKFIWASFHHTSSFNSQRSKTT